MSTGELSSMEAGAREALNLLEGRLISGGPWEGTAQEAISILYKAIDKTRQDLHSRAERSRELAEGMRNSWKPGLAPNIVCHAPGDRCLGCAHYRGSADKCELAGGKPSNEDRCRSAVPALLDALEQLLTHTVDADLNAGIELTEGEEQARSAALAAIEAVGDTARTFTSGINSPEQHSLFLLAQRGLEDLGIYLADNDPIKDGYSEEEAEEMRNLLKAGPALLAKMEAR